MSLPTKAVDRIFERMAATYGASWDRSLGQSPLTDVKGAWGHELSGFAERLSDIAWALDNLPERVPNVIEFRNHVRRAPASEVLRLPEPKADPARIAAELAKLAPLRVEGTARRNDTAWAHRIVAKKKAGVPVSVAVFAMAKSVADKYPL